MRNDTKHWENGLSIAILASKWIGPQKSHSSIIVLISELTHVRLHEIKTNFVYKRPIFVYENFNLQVVEDSHSHEFVVIAKYLGTFSCPHYGPSMFLSICNALGYVDYLKEASVERYIDTSQGSLIHLSWKIRLNRNNIFYNKEKFLIANKARYLITLQISTYENHDMLATVFCSSLKANSNQTSKVSLEHLVFLVFVTYLCFWYWKSCYHIASKKRRGF